MAAALHSLPALHLRRGEFLPEIRTESSFLSVTRGTTFVMGKAGGVMRGSHKTQEIGSASQPELYAVCRNHQKPGEYIVLFLVTALVTVISVLMPRLSGEAQLEISFLPQLLFALVALVVTLNLRVASQRKSLLSVSKALLDSISHMDRLAEFSFIDPQTQTFSRSYLYQLFSQQSKLSNRAAPQPHCAWLRSVRTDGLRFRRSPTRLSRKRHWFFVPIFAVPTFHCALYQRSVSHLAARYQPAANATRIESPDQQDRILQP